MPASTPTRPKPATEQKYDEGLLVAKIEKNANEQVRIRLTSYRGFNLVDLRMFYLADDGFRPSGKGFALRRDRIGDLRQALEEAERITKPATRISREAAASRSITMDQLSSLTDREREVLTLAGEGLASKAIGERLFISKRTVDFHLANIYSKLGVGSRLQALRVAGLLAPVQPERKTELPADSDLVFATASARLITLAQKRIVEQVLLNHGGGIEDLIRDDSKTVHEKGCMCLWWMAGLAMVHKRGLTQRQVAEAMLPIINGREPQTSMELDFVRQRNRLMRLVWSGAKRIVARKYASP